MSGRRWVSSALTIALLACANDARPNVGTAAVHASLGAKLFEDPILSRDSTVSCATCHIPDRAFSEDRAVSHGVGTGARRRNTPSLTNVTVFRQSFDWDGRATSLEDQLNGVFSRAGDMGHDLGDVVKRLRRSTTYDSAFLAAFARRPDVDALVTALVEFQRGLVSQDSRFVRFYQRGDSTALTSSEKRGWEVFRGSGCAGCHVPLPDPKGTGIIVFSDSRFHNLGVGYKDGVMQDLGRYEVTQDPADWGAFRTPQLHDVSRTSPYMHDGSLATLEEVIDFYDRGGIPNPNLDPIMVKRRFTPAQRKELLAFLKALESLPNAVALGT